MSESWNNSPFYGFSRCGRNNSPWDEENATERPNKRPKRGGEDIPLLPIDQIDEELEQIMYHRDVPIYKDADGMYAILVHNDSEAKHHKIKTVKTHHLSSIKRIINGALQNDQGRFRYMNRAYVLAV